ncbi:diphthine--ammonia ligase isoform X1 [Iris pallida]|uniref:Diphthine--ammonia ligase n=1 Tax=Iris pallida TaxID=29817 RepID=A0AAX6HB09_IRIPA|nr:diphthine--ammonia ligase isoform X1 [Iris pallida]
MKVVGLVSGGKDSCYAMMRCIDYGHEIVALANLLPLDDSVDELDSYMYQTVGHQIVVSYAECVGLPLFRRRIRGSTRHHDLSYKVTPGDEVEDLFILLNEVKSQVPSVAAVSSGAIASDYQRLRVESVCARLGLVSLAYLWKQDQTFLLEEMIRRGIKAITIKVAAMGLHPSKHLGKELSDLQAHLLQMKELYGLNVCGEGGEYETLTLDCPLFHNARIVLDKFQVILHSPDSIAPVAVLHPRTFHLEHKREIPPLSSQSGNDRADLEKIGCIYEVQGDSSPDYLVKCQSVHLSSDFDTAKKLNLCISTFKRDTFSISCWAQSYSRTLEGLQEDMTAVLRTIESQLSKNGFDWSNVLYIHLYISDMKQFALANEVYTRFITEKKCYLGVPSRSTIELPLVQVGLGNAYVEVLVANDQSKRVIHVQSISCWAPSCIGPYSQATLHKEVLYMAGQLGLDPPTMVLRCEGAAAEMEQALENCEAVANNFNSSLASAILLVIYCSATVASSERNEIENMIKFFLRRRVSHLQKERLPRSSDPIFLYTLAPSLPKGALVEVKPVLHVPESRGDEVEATVPPATNAEVSNNWGLECCEWHETCYQIYTIYGKICATLVSITKDVATNICSIANQNYLQSEKWTTATAKLCIHLLDKVLSKNDFTWGDLRNLRIYFQTEPSIDVDMMFHVFHKTFNEFAELSKKMEVGKEPIFSLIPVLGSGRSASMEDLITCELFASKL